MYRGKFSGGYDYLFKILLIGDPAVGKSSLVYRFSENVFSEDYQSTIGVDFVNKHIKIKGTTIDGKIIKLQLWDTAGQERFKSITHTYYKGSEGVIIVFDVTKPKTFHNLAFWNREIAENADIRTQKILVGNKCDSTDQRKISKEEAMEYAKQNGMDYFETSAKTGENVEEMFLNLASKIKEKIVENNMELVRRDTLEQKLIQDAININDIPKREKVCCS